ncbi:MAG TPA: DUF488 domain-containing protein [Candidatus Limnocylindrales bacterium]|nr:DUF488 domain-containing protein [Candidatus Limnocylindrales bacterium]
MIQTKRVYEKPESADGFRVLVDRLWPRGMTKEKAHVDLWMKEIAPSDALRKWFHHEERDWDVFLKRYKAELTKKRELLSELSALEKEHGTVTLLFGSKDEKQNQAVVLAAMLKGK